MATTVSAPMDFGRNRTGWMPVLLGLACVLAAITLLFFDTARSMVAIWMRSDTYAHGFLILPVSLWLVWERREGLSRCSPEPTLVPVWLMLPTGLAWLAAHLVDVLVVQQYAFVGLWVLAIWAMLGTSVARYFAFPIGFLLFAVPVGESLTYPMMDITADFTVAMLRLTGIPVFRDGTFFSIPSGDWSVVEACSGLRYLIASVTLGVLYAYLTYTKLWKRLIFIAFALIVPVIANGLRAYMIVMIAHLSDMRLATGVDHLIYGWLFFGVIVTIMFAIGAIWRDQPSEARSLPAFRGTSRFGVVAVGLAAVCAAALWASLGWVLSRAGPEGAVALQAPKAAYDWRLDDSDGWDWRPKVVGADGDLYRFYRAPQGLVGLYLGLYRSQRQGAELVSSANQMAEQQDLRWSDKEIVRRRIALPEGELTVDEHRLESRGGRRLLVWSWYRVGGMATSDPYVAKLAEAGQRLVGRRDGALIAVAAPYEADREQAASLLTGFLSVMFASIDAELDRAVATDP